MQDESLAAQKQQIESEQTHQYILSVYIEDRNFPVDIRFGVEENYKRIVANMDEITLDDIGEYRLYWGIHDAYGEVLNTSAHPRYYGKEGEDNGSLNLPF